MRFTKINDISTALGVNFKDFVRDLYQIKKLSCQEISENIFNKSGINITARSIQRFLKSMGSIRTYSQAFTLAIARGRKSYDGMRKPIKSAESRKGINLKLRYKIFERDQFKCVLCGATAKDEKLVIDHIVPVVSGGTNNETNLRTLCRQCNHGKMLLNERI